MTHDFPRHLKLIFRALLRGDTERCAQGFAFPLAIFIDDKNIVFPTSESYAAALAGFGQELRDEGWAATEIELANMTTGHNGQFSVRGEIRYLSRQRTVVASTPLRFYVDGSTNTPRILMVEYLDAPDMIRQYVAPCRLAA